MQAQKKLLRHTPQEFFTQIIHMTISTTKIPTVLRKTFCRIKTMDIIFMPFGYT